MQAYYFNFFLFFCKNFYRCNFLKIKQKAPNFKNFAFFFHFFCENILVFNFCLLILQSRNTRTKHENVTGNQNGEVAQLVEHRTENPCVGGSSPPFTTKTLSDSFLRGFCDFRGKMNVFFLSTIIVTIFYF